MHLGRERHRIGLGWLWRSFAGAIHRHLSPDPGKYQWIHGSGSIEIVITSSPNRLGSVSSCPWKVDAPWRITTQIGPPSW